MRNSLFYYFALGFDFFFFLNFIVLAELINCFMALL